MPEQMTERGVEQIGCQEKMSQRMHVKYMPYKMSEYPSDRMPEKMSDIFRYNVSWLGSLDKTHLIQKSGRTFRATPTRN